MRIGDNHRSQRTFVRFMTDRIEIRPRAFEQRRVINDKLVVEEKEKPGEEKPYATLAQVVTIHPQHSFVF